MARTEAGRTDAIEAVAIVTPNHMHAPVAAAFLETGVHIICDKPLTTPLGEARRLRDKARTSGLIFAVTYNYSGYPLVRHARSMVQGGELGAIRIVQLWTKAVNDLWLVEQAFEGMARAIESGAASPGVPRGKLAIGFTSIR